MPGGTAQEGGEGEGGGGEEESREGRATGSNQTGSLLLSLSVLHQ